MSVTVSKLQRTDIPPDISGPVVEVAFLVFDQQGHGQYLLDDVEVAQTAVRASDKGEAPHN